jgi:uncharacterized protein
MSEAPFTRCGVLLLTVLLSVAPFARSIAQLEHFPTASLTIQTAAGPDKFRVEVATTPAQLEQGLMYRRHLDPDAGMIFIFPQPEPTAFWMKNTLIPLDMLFVDADSRIVNIHERAVPMSLEPIDSAGPVGAVIEFNGGTAKRLGIRRGDRVIFPAFGDGH